MFITPLLFTILVALISGIYSKSVELTFELPDSAVECFYQEIDQNTSATLEYQVITGGQYDVDVKIEGPNKQILYQQQKMQYDSHKFIAQQTGVYKACFSNEFSTFSHKLVYMEFNVGPEQPLPGIGEHATVLTQLETSAEEIHSALNKIIDQQTHHRLREAQGRKRAEDLNERVFWWSMGETLAIMCVALAQVMVLKNFFSDRPSLYNMK
ncbi:transmembrane emp24 domain-containing protein 7 [Vanessa tameamea]|uniref:Transmembrane emp24 domain-containing protein 7 n=1 Tax=Vanessa tameamea TaxID=334116 RepID=A0A8B8HKX9_VANTA|nr:transmembrane emp24 domain-containing protein 7 [Vanessa tameamea]XP_046967292.1 transmembrane emp24 domain-containing protein 7 [Vanessa cardui]XP_047531560.1 transmembrane emp24 domain-containing protein 7 [Vanessa atalanta]